MLHVTEKVWQRIGYTGILIIVLFSYFLFNRHLPPKITPITYLDNVIPFAPPWSLAYVSYLFLVWGSIAYGFFFCKFEWYRRFILALLTVQVIAYIVYILVPGYIERPVPEGEEFGIDIVRAIYAIDRPTSTLTPSLHVANSWLIALMTTKKFYTRAFLVFWAILIILSTLLIKQHYVIDVISGIFLSTMTYLVFERSRITRKGSVDE